MVSAGAHDEEHRLSGPDAFVVDADAGRELYPRHASRSGAADDGEGFGFEKQAGEAQLRGLDHRRCRVVPAREELSPDSMDRVDIGEVGHVRGHSHDVGDLAACRLDDDLNVLPGLARLSLGVPRSDDAELFVKRDLSGDEEHAADLDSVRVRPRQWMDAMRGPDDLFLASLDHDAFSSYEMYRRSIVTAAQ